MAGERLGRLKEQNWRASQAFDVTIKKLARRAANSSLEITWQRRPSSPTGRNWRTAVISPQQPDQDVDAGRRLWKRYIQLTEAEWAFRITKDELAIRPIWHQKEDRVKAHILVCFLAYVLWKTLAGWMRNAGLGDAPRTLIEEFAKIKSGDVTLSAR